MIKLFVHIYICDFRAVLLVLFFSLIFIPRLNEPFKNEEILIIFFFQKIRFGVKKIFFAVFG